MRGGRASQLLLRGQQRRALHQAMRKGGWRSEEDSGAMRGVDRLPSTCTTTTVLYTVTTTTVLYRYCAVLWGRSVSVHRWERTVFYYWAWADWWPSPPLIRPLSHRPALSVSPITQWTAPPTTTTVFAPLPPSPHPSILPLLPSLFLAAIPSINLGALPPPLCYSDPPSPLLLQML